MHLHNRLPHGQKSQHCSSVGTNVCSQPQRSCLRESPGTQLLFVLGRPEVGEAQGTLWIPSQFLLEIQLVLDFDQDTNLSC